LPKEDTIDIKEYVKGKASEIGVEAPDENNWEIFIQEVM